MSLTELIDTHCHIVFPDFQDDIEEVASRWREAGVKSLLHACVEPSEIPAIKSLADRFKELRYAVGVHPLDTQHWDERTIPLLRESIQADQRVVAVGELGLDLFRDKNLEEQMAILRPQLDLASECNLPVIIHCRDAAEPMAKELRARKEKGFCPQGVMHCWGGTPAEMKTFLELGFYISFSGTVTFSKAEAIRESARIVPDNKFLIETDCPFLAPVPKRGKRNEPALVKHVAQCVADLRKQSFQSVAASSTANARRLFDLP